MPNRPLAVVTCGPAHEPIDAVRRLTNLSSGELGTLLAEALVADGFQVICLRGEMASARPPVGADIIPFSTNASVLEILRGLPTKPVVLFHAAALCDFTVAEVTGAPAAQKIRSDAPELHLTLKPAVKVLPQLPGLFPETIIVGWKYELDGTRADAIARGRRQLATAQTAACVVNGKAYGAGFGLLERDAAEPVDFPSKADLCAYLPGWARARITPR